jgi:hypothetical protein
MWHITLVWLLSVPLARASNRTVGPAATEIHYHGAWSSASASSGATYQLSRDADATATFAFTGTCLLTSSRAVLTARRQRGVRPLHRERAGRAGGH